MVDIKDLAGLSEPLKRLVEVIADGIGGVSRPILVRKNADAKAYEIRAIADAIVESQKLLGPVSYSDGELVIESSKEGSPPELPEASFEKRVVSRLAYQEAKRQSNVEQITQEAAKELADAKSVGPERPARDWTARFFRIAEDISTEEMQGLWGKVLAGEVKRPGSFSLRSLDLLKNISQREAETFAKVARLAFTSVDKVFIPNRDNGKFLEEHFGISFMDLFLLRELGLLAPSDLQFSLLAVKKDSFTLFTCGPSAMFVNRPAGTPMQPVNAIVFTEIGGQLLKLVDRVPADPLYIAHLAKVFQTPGVVVQSGTLSNSEIGGETTLSELQDVPGNIPKPEHTAK